MGGEPDPCLGVGQCARRPADFVGDDAVPGRRANSLCPSAGLGRGDCTALAAAAFGYLSLMLVDCWFKVDFRFWIVGLKLLDARHLRDFLTYLPPFAAAFLIMARAQSRNLAVEGESAFAACGWSMAATGGGFVVLLGCAQYLTLFVTGRLILAGRGAEHHHRHPVRPPAGVRRTGRRLHGAADEQLPARRPDLRAGRHLVHRRRHRDPLDARLEIHSDGHGLYPPRPAPAAAP